MDAELFLDGLSAMDQFTAKVNIAAVAHVSDSKRVLFVFMAFTSVIIFRIQIYYNTFTEISNISKKGCQLYANSPFNIMF